MAIIKLSATERRRASAFFTCLVLAIFAWMFTVLSGSHKYTVKGILAFKNTPQKRAFHALQPDTVNVNIYGTGWEMLYSKIKGGSRSISVDLQSLESKNFVVLSSQLNHINIAKDTNQEIIGFNPDTLYFDFSNRKEKRVPVHLVEAIKFQHQFFQSDNVILRPAYVIINGPANVIDKITTWNTDSLKLDNVDETIAANVPLQPSNEGNISVYPKFIQATVPVDEFTEKVVELPVKITNNNSYGDVKIFPQKIKVTFITSLNKYDELDEDFFEADVDLALWHYQHYKVLPVMINKIPAFCKIVRIEPQNIDFYVKE